MPRNFRDLITYITPQSNAFASSALAWQCLYFFTTRCLVFVYGVEVMKLFNIATVICSFAEIAQALTTYGLMPRKGADDSYAIASIKQNGIIATFGFKQEPGDQMRVRVIVEQGLNETIHPYHVHLYPVPPNNDCYRTGRHLDPMRVRGSDRCNSKNGYQCEVGDLSGKHGPLKGSEENFQLIDIQYDDADLTFTGNNSIVERSVVIHRYDNSRLACANITVVDESVFNSYLPSEN
ncbi:uncharacterized protein VTP21DRAFT_2335 [Calcarisporiella thermophila]|uniref:uncharacterized protein n=1 Tax=Calcarisporiella thermophila TaxID=911321 RepID=UPI0037438B96